MSREHSGALSVDAGWGAYDGEGDAYSMSSALVSMCRLANSATQSAGGRCGLKCDRVISCSRS